MFFRYVIPLVSGIACLVSGSEQQSPSGCVSRCKAVPGTPGWPSPDSWAALNASTGGRLLQPLPPGAVCHPDQPDYNATQCLQVQQGWTLSPFHDNDPVSVGSIEFTNDSCLPLATYPCSSEGYPVFVINATTADHVKLGVDFARNNNVRLIVKASGHDYIGRSVAPYSLSIWTRHMTGVTINQDGFQPQGCSGSCFINSPTVTAAGGTQMGVLQNATATINQTIVGGGSETVSVGGYLTGGGHGLLSARYGLATDQVVEMEVVTPDGAILTLNECQNQDMFWAMRGGGGSTFGIMTSVTIKTHPSPPIVTMILYIGTLDLDNPSNYDTLAYILSNYPSLGDAGVAGYSYYYPVSPNPLGGNASVNFMPAFATNTGKAPKNIIWIHCTLDAEKTRIVDPPERFLPVGPVRIRLLTISP